MPILPCRDTLEALEWNELRILEDHVSHHILINLPFLLDHLLYVIPVTSELCLLSIDFLIFEHSGKTGVGWG